MEAGCRYLFPKQVFEEAYEGKLSTTRNISVAGTYCVKRLTLLQIQLNANTVSEYVIRTQPTENSLSTLECAAVLLEYTERNKEIKEVI